ncbi:hypothetical protein [Rhizobium phage RHph_X2_24]|nr:hypothetical protein [Rhizobium phage RHph_X2_24]
MFKISVEYVTLTDGSTVHNVKLTTPAGDFIEIPAVTETAADSMAQKIADAINEHSTETVLYY